MSLKPFRIPDAALMLDRTLQMLKMLGDTRTDVMAFLIENDLDAPLARSAMIGRVQTWDGKIKTWRPVNERALDWALHWLRSKGYVKRIGREDIGRRASYYRANWSP